MVREKKNKKINQRSFYFDDYDSHPKPQLNKNKLNVSEDRIYLLFFVFFSLILILQLKYLQHLYRSLILKIIKTIIPFLNQ